MAGELHKYLRDLERRLDDAQEEANVAAWRAFVDGTCAEPIFVPPPRKSAPATLEWPAVSINDALDDVNLMVLRELKGVSDLLATGGGGRLSVRCNYGTGILPTLFGCELFVMPRDTETLPTAKPLHARGRIMAVLDAGLPALREGLGGKVFECAARFQGIFRAYPGIGRHVDLYHPDTQGPVDIAEVVWGSDFFLALYEEPELVRKLLALITDTYAAFLREWYRAAPPGPYSTHWGLMYKGRLMIRNDSLMNLSPKVYTDLVRPLDQKLFDEFGGGAVHFCGRGDHYIAAMSEMRGLTAINMSQPHLNDMEKIYRSTVNKGIKLIGFDRTTAEKAKAEGRLPKGQVQC